MGSLNHAEPWTEQPDHNPSCYSYELLRPAPVQVLLLWSTHRRDKLSIVIIIVIIISIVIMIIIINIIMWLFRNGHSCSLPLYVANSTR